MMKLISLPKDKSIIRTKWIFRNKLDQHAKCAFLNGIINEVFVKQSLGLESDSFPNHVFKLKIALYGLKQAPLDIIFYATNDTFCEEFSKKSLDEHDGRIEVLPYTAN
ncbi:hypothetical protein CR513_42813, partial [Mucuna pruriens]